MIGPLSNTSLKQFEDILTNILYHTNLQNEILQLKTNWHNIDYEEKAKGIIRDNNYHAKQFGLEAQDVFYKIASSYGFEYLSKLLKDPNHEKDLRLGDFVLPLINAGTSILLDIKFCYTNAQNRYASISSNSERNYGGWYICFSTNCDSLIGIWAEYFKEQIDKEVIQRKSICYLYNDYEPIIEKALKENSPYVFKIGI